MPRPRKDGTPASPARRKNFTELYVRKARPEPHAYNVWDAKERGLVLRIQPSGARAFKVVYSYRGRPRWFHVGHVGLADARRIAAKVRLAVAEGKDPVAERKAERGAGTFAELAARYVEQHAKRKNKSWKQADALVSRYVLPRWGKLEAKSISRSDVRQLIARIEAPVLANQVLAAASAIFSWAVKQEIVAVNPCRGVERNETKSRERVLSDSEIPKFWSAFDTAGLVRGSALKVVLLTGQRPGEVAKMRKEHVAEGWWTMPGEPVLAIGWPGTKNGATHRVWLPRAVQDIIAELSDGATTDFVFAGPRSKPIDGLSEAMRSICAELGVNDKVTPHDLRRTHGSTITGLGFGRDAMNRVQNHREGGIADVYDRHEYADENKRVIEAVAAHILALAEGRQASNVGGTGAPVVPFSRRKGRGADA
jgi:integrase